MENRLRVTIKKYWLLIILSIIAGGLIAFWLSQKIKPSSVLTTPPTGEMQGLMVINRSPKLETFEAANTITPVYITFNQPIDLSTLIIDQQPIQEFEIQIRAGKPEQLVINPKTPWKVTQSFQLKIRSGLKSTDGQFVLKEDVFVDFTVVEVPLPELDQPI